MLNNDGYKKGKKKREREREREKKEWMDKCMERRVRLIRCHDTENDTYFCPAFTKKQQKIKKQLTCLD